MKVRRKKHVGQSDNLHIFIIYHIGIHTYINELLDIKADVKQILTPFVPLFSRPFNKKVSIPRFRAHLTTLESKLHW